MCLFNKRAKALSTFVSVENLGLLLGVLNDHRYLMSKFNVNNFVITDLTNSLQLRSVSGTKSDTSATCNHCKKKTLYAGVKEVNGFQLTNTFM